MLDWIAELSLLTVISMGAVVTCSALKVTPEIVEANVLVAEDTAIPLTVALASAAACVTVAPLTRRDKPVASALAALWGAVAPSSLTLRRNPNSSPVLLLRSSKRSPDASLSTDAVTPALAPLILLATSDSLSLALIVMSTG